jgi:benzoyl-CoA reductase subunit D
MTRRAGMAGKAVLIGGLARNVGFVQALNAGLGAEATVPDDPEFVSALGAALLAAEGGLAPEISD